ncbi:MAG: Dihydrofolate synthase @ Folylpolyglutamate synthase [uncultured Solirubrobacteraceae bacterium]|uniref:tetrahydrofolate synthase n=1 Tax=uncultured Solirubrobacteraceae bacterium TaxID=1162706 RepID=A0A6J4RKD9_9ACTN|nr:MAG: Dihydrofolate synthase @ Folylpolyglutamate synthase [uncultured Solirubrobacteraceae bacterium]
MARPWTAEQAEEHLLSLELFGMRFGLERMRRLLTVLGSPQEAFASIHVVGTNGKSSTTRMTAAILEAHGVRTGTFLSPHLTSFAERIRIGDADLEPAAFGAAVGRAADAARMVDRTLEGDERVTQFELLTAAALAELAERGVEVAVIEAGLGGRHDATNVLTSSRVQVLTNVGLEHTRWLGPTIRDIAREKLAVVRPGATLVVGELEPEADEEAVATAQRLGARLVRVPAEPLFQGTNFEVARAAALAHRGELDPDRVADAAARTEVPGRFQRVGERPLTIVDGAHNPSGILALDAALAVAAGDRRRVAVVSVLDDKDAAGMLRELLEHCEAAVFTSSQNRRALPPATLASLAAQVGWRGEPVLENEPRVALERARALAGPDGAVVATGSIYLVADLLSSPGARRASAL